MKLKSARQAWHDSLYMPWDSVLSVAAEWALLGASVQKTERDSRNRVAMHQALAGQIQRAIATLPSHLQAFGHWLYSPFQLDDHREIAEELVFALAVAESKRMTSSTYERARHVAAGVLHRYRRQHQGGQSEGVDPLPTPESFRRWLADQYGLELRSESWARDWEAFVELCFCACDKLDRAALAPVAVTVRLMCEREAA